MKSSHLPLLGLLLLKLTLVCGPVLTPIRATGQSQDAMTTLQTLNHNRHRLLSWTNLTEFTPDRREDAGTIRWMSPVADPGFAWNEAVLSWNTRPGITGVVLGVYIRTFDGDSSSGWFDMGTWDGAPESTQRTSHGKQENRWGWVDTDVLKLKLPSQKFQIGLETQPVSPPDQTLKFLAVSLLNDSVEPIEPPANRSAWGKSIQVRPISQLWYEGGNVWCSPTCVTMLLNYWGQRLNLSYLDLQVPEVVSGLYDPQWNGTGNWSFNVAFAGQHKGIRSYVTRLGGLADLEAFIVNEQPVIASVSSDILNGLNSAGNGHLILVTGFTPDGDVEVNDPAGREDVQRVYQREVFRKAWADSKQTVYWMGPDDLVN